MPRPAPLAMERRVDVLTRGMYGVCLCVAANCCRLTAQQEITLSARDSCYQAAYARHASADRTGREKRV